MPNEVFASLSRVVPTKVELVEKAYLPVNNILFSQFVVILPVSRHSHRTMVKQRVGNVKQTGITCWVNQVRNFHKNIPPAIPQLLQHGAA